MTVVNATRPGDRLFGRECGLIVFPPADNFGVNVGGRVEFVGLRTAFEINKSLAPNPNTSQVTVYNLARDSQALFVKGARVVLQAGYSGTLEQIFVGDVRHAPTRRQSADASTKIELDDGGRGFAFGYVQESFAAKVAAGQVLLRVAKSLGVGLGNVPQAAAELDRVGQYQSGIVLQGRASVAMDKVCAAWGYSWSIQDGQLQVNLDGASLADIVVLSPETGLVGSPELGTAKKKGGKAIMKIRSLLQPKIRPGTRIKLVSEFHQGIFRAEKVGHVGDTRGPLWFSEIEATAMS